MLDLTLDQRQPEDNGWELDEWRAAELSCLPPAGAALRLWLGDAELDPYLRPGDPCWRWRVAAQGAVGTFAILLRAEWPDGRAEELRASLYMRPRKLDADRYQALLLDLQHLGRALVFALGGGAEPAGWPDGQERGPGTPAEELAGLLGPEAERFMAAAERIARRPADRLRPALRQVEPGQARDLSAVDRARISESAPQADGGDPADLARRLAAIPERRPDPSHDSYESRMLKRAVAALARRLGLLLKTADLPAAARARPEAALARLRGLLARPPLAELAPLSQFAGPSARMQRDPDYRAVYRMWQLLRRRPQIQWDAATLSITIQELPRLYERWCAARVALTMLGLPDLRLLDHGLARQGESDELEWALGLVEGGPLLALEGHDGLRLTLRYQPRYTPGGAPLRSLDRHTRVPDLAIELARPGLPPRLLMLDAKYRLDASGGVPEDALADAYSYLGSIGTPDGARAALAVALLYPGRGPAEIYPSAVAALPLVPGEEGELAGWLGRSIARAW